MAKITPILKSIKDARAEFPSYSHAIQQFGPLRIKYWYIVVDEGRLLQTQTHRTCGILAGADYAAYIYGM